MMKVEDFVSDFVKRGYIAPGASRIVAGLVYKSHRLKDERVSWWRRFVG